MKRISLIITLILIIQGFSYSQEHDHRYTPPGDSLTELKLKEWQNLKFGLLMHWGPYSQWGVVESWSICPEDWGWCERKKGNHPENYVEYVKEYEGLQRTFNPVNFNPERWAVAAKEAGMRYVVFTTKHHDGFCMFDSKYTDYKISGPASPFKDNPRKNVAFEIFKAFRNQGLWTGAYFSKPDWHSPYYWDPYFPPLDRNVNYDPQVYPEKWQKFTEYTHNQILELMSDYGKMDILWLDGGWVAKESKENIISYYDEWMKKGDYPYLFQRIVNQDIKMDELVEKVRAKQPGLIVVDRAVPGKNQNYLTPENTVPNEPLLYPWESCIIFGGGWSFSPGASYMEPRKAIHLLINIVAKGGNLLLNIAPGPDGEWQEGAYELLKAYGDWMKINSTAIYDTRYLEPYKSGQVCMTQKDGGYKYFFYLLDETETRLPETIEVKGVSLAKVKKVRMLGSTASIKYIQTGDGIQFQVPAALRNAPPSRYAVVIEVKEG
ncbi:MAG: alpha-L-fucosidase [Bacteroidales bacterium]|nr:alpha-L-fucosidase [Bacteroidales bacterium]